MNPKNHVYLAGLPRGGTTLISQILGQHREIEQMGESMYTGVLNPVANVCSCGVLGCCVSQEIFELAMSDEDILNIRKAYAIIDKTREPNKIPHSLTVSAIDENFVLCNDFDELLLSAQKGFDKLVNIFSRVVGNYSFVDNTKEIVFAENIIKSNNWKVVLITRDPRGIAYSVKKAGLRKGVPRDVYSKIPVFIDFAVKAVRLMESTKVFLVRYEDLCKNPRIVVESLCDFIGIAYSDELLAFKLNKSHTIMGNRMRYDSNQLIVEDLAWKKYLSREEVLSISNNVQLVELYRRLGYDLGTQCS